MRSTASPAALASPAGVGTWGGLGLALLSAGSCLAVAGIVFGAWLALRFQVWRIERA